MTARHIVAGLMAALLLGLGAWLWTRQGVMVWLQDAIRYCF